MKYLLIFLYLMDMPLTYAGFYECVKGKKDIYTCYYIDEHKGKNHGRFHDGRKHRIEK